MRELARRLRNAFLNGREDKTWGNSPVVGMGLLWTLAYRAGYSLRPIECCQFCGYEGSKADPIISCVVAPPCDSYEAEESRMHHRCMCEASKLMVV